MADVQLENGYVKLANPLLDAYLRLRLTSYQSSVFFCIVRKTYGFNKKKDRISLSQFEKCTGILRRHVLKTLKELEKMNLITVDKKSHMQVIYGVQKDFDRWATVPERGNSLEPSRKSQLYPNEGITVPEPGYKTVPEPGNNKRQYKRHITKDNSAKPCTSAKDSTTPVQSLFSKETLEAYSLTFTKYKTLPTGLKEPVITL